MQDYRFSYWMLLLAPANTPMAVVNKIAADVANILQEPETRKRLEEGGVDPMGLHGSDLARFMEEERIRYTKLAKARNIKFSD